MDEIFVDQDSSWTPLDTKELKPREKMWLRILNSMSTTITTHFNMARRTGDHNADWAARRRSRTVGIGVSPCALAWTDGSTYVYFDRKYLEQHDFNLQGLMEMAGTMLHEYCHDAPDSETHTHSQEFYEQFHDNFEAAHGSVTFAFANLEKWLATEDRRLTKKLLKERDKYEGVLKQRELLKLSEDALELEAMKK
jgi:hypothetical protein